MSRSPPEELVHLLAADGPGAEDAAWSDFLARYSPTLLDAARRSAADRDGAMDRYLWILQELRRDDYRRLRQYRPKERSQFSSWLLVVARRLCVDYARRRYGRDRGREASPTTRRRRAARRRLARFEMEELDPELVGDPAARGPERRVRARELAGALEIALAGLEPRDRLLLRLRYEDEVPVREITGVMNFPTVFHVYRRLRRLRGKLRDRLEELGVADPWP